MCLYSNNSTNCETCKNTLLHDRIQYKYFIHPKLGNYVILAANIKLYENIIMICKNDFSIISYPEEPK